MAAKESGSEAAGLVETRTDPNSDAAARTTTAAGPKEGCLPEIPPEEELNGIATYFRC